MENSKFNKLKKYFVDFIFAVSLLFFIIASNFQDGRFKGWELQYLPVGNGISDVIFLDSITGYLSMGVSSNISYILKTTNAGDNWIIKKTNTHPFTKIVFLNKNVGYSASWDTLFKTTNAGENWTNIPTGYWGIWIDDMHILNEDTIWIAMSEGLTGGLFRTTDGGQSWTRQFYQYNENPNQIYMVNKNLGFMSCDQAYTGRTTNGGFNWSITIEDSTFRNIIFIDSLIGYRSFVGVKKTTNGGLNWFSQILPTVIGSIFNGKAMLNFSAINKDTVYGVGGFFDYPNNQTKCIVYKTTNGGINWGYQVPDTNFIITQLRKISFIDNLKGWAFRLSDKDIHTIVGGDSTIITGIINNNFSVINNFELFQNYPNPFNAITKIKFSLSSNVKGETSNVKLVVHNILGKEIENLVDKKMKQGTYEYSFDGSNLSSGIYFYKLTVDENLEVKKMILLK